MSETFFPVEPQPFTDAYPDFEQLEIAIKILDSGGKEIKEELYSDSLLPKHDVKCGHLKCWGGGLSLKTIGSAISTLYKYKDPEFSDYIFCKGGRYRGSKRYGPCGWAFKLLLKARYK